jgi:hypothetical protein
MSGNHHPKATSVSPSPALIVIADTPHFGRWKAGDQRVGQTDDGEQVRVPPAQALQHAQADDLADFLRRRQEPGRDRLRSSTGGRSGQSPGACRDELLAKVEDLARTLKEKVARYSSLRAAQSCALAAEPVDATAALWVQQALEDIAATALRIHVASREIFLEAASAEERESRSEEPRTRRPEPQND